MSKFLNLIENYDPNNDGYYTDVHDLKMLFKSHGIKFGVREGGVFYIDDAANEKTYVVKIEGIKSSDKREEDGEASAAYDIVSATSTKNPKSAQAKKAFDDAAKVKLPIAISKVNAQTAEISKMKL
jgi:hypothetical protein